MEVATFQGAKRLEELEVVIKRDLGSFYEVGRALKEIRDDELYKLKKGGDYKTFEEYARSIWDMARQTAHQYIAAFKVVQNVRLGGQKNIVPANEKQCRPLTRLTTDKQIEAWQQVIDMAPDGKITGPLVYRIVKDMLPPKPSKPSFVPSPSTPESPIPGDAYYFVNMAISQLERIRGDDPLRVDAYGRLKEWMVQHN
ncbi:MAG TPA: hypothetical protein DDZ40_07390 [Deltaproteobacteria bacterium]|nr:hypothetical protein [Deltaproteobacteria bacterium]